MSVDLEEIAKRVNPIVERCGGLEEREWLQIYQIYHDVHALILEVRKLRKERIQLICDAPEDDKPKSHRDYFAMMALQGLLGKAGIEGKNPDFYAHLAVQFADALIKKLDQ